MVGLHKDDGITEMGAHRLEPNGYLAMMPGAHRAREETPSPCEEGWNVKVNRCKKGILRPVKQADYHHAKEERKPRKTYLGRDR